MDSCYVLSRHQILVTLQRCQIQTHKQNGMDTVMLLSHISLQPQYVIQIIVDTDDHLE